MGSDYGSCYPKHKRLINKRQQRCDNFIADIKTIRQQGNSKGQGPAHTFVNFVDILNLDLEFDEHDNQGNHGKIWLSDKWHAKINLLSDTKSTVRKQLTTWIRRAYIANLRHRCRRDEENLFVDNGRKDMEFMPEHIDRGATMANFEQRSGNLPYGKDKMLANCLKSILAGSVQFGDRLKAAQILDSDECTCEECHGKRHTAQHVFWECPRHAAIRSNYTKRFETIFDSLKKEQGSGAVEELANCLNNETFQVTGLCPDHEQSLEEANRRIHSENIKHKVADTNLIIHEGVKNMSYEEHEGVTYAVAYTDGSLYDRQSDNFCRAGWGAYFAPRHELNAKGPVDSRRPTTFRAELRAVYHIFQHAACDILIRCDCKGVVKLIDKILEGEGFDSTHEDADLLEAINNIHTTIAGRRIIKWIPAHLDEPKNAKKR